MYPVNEEVMSLIRLKIADMLTYSQAPQMKWVDIDIACRYILEAGKSGRAWIYDGYMVLFDIGCDWYSDKPYLIEQLVLRLHESEHGVASAIALLKQMASLNGCVAVAAGDTQVIGYMTEKYKEAGFSVIGTQLYMEVD